MNEACSKSFLLKFIGEKVSRAHLLKIDQRDVYSSSIYTLLSKLLQNLYYIQYFKLIHNQCYHKNMVSIIFVAIMIFNLLR